MTSTMSRTSKHQRIAWWVWCLDEDQGVVWRGPGPYPRKGPAIAAAIQLSTQAHLEAGDARAYLALPEWAWLEARHGRAADDEGIG